MYSDVNSGAFGSNACVDYAALTRSSSSWNETWIENTFILYYSSVPYHIDKCDTADLFVPYFANNKIYLPSGREVAFTCKVNGSIARLNL